MPLKMKIPRRLKPRILPLEISTTVLGSEAMSSGVEVLGFGAVAASVECAAGSSAETAPAPAIAVPCTKARLPICRHPGELFFIEASPNSIAPRFQRQLETC